MKQFKIDVTSVPDRDNLVAEIWYGESLIAEINQETKNLEIEIYAAENLSFELNDFQNVLEQAKNKLKR